MPSPGVPVVVQDSTGNRVSAGKLGQGRMMLNLAQSVYLAKLVAPGDKDNTPIWLTILCGIGGVILGWYVYSAFGGDGSAGIDCVRWLVAVIVAAVLVVTVSTLAGRNTGNRTHT